MEMVAMSAHQNGSARSARRPPIVKVIQKILRCTRILYAGDGRRSPSHRCEQAYFAEGLTHAPHWVHRDFRNSMMASWSERFSRLNCKVTWLASPRWRVMASRSVNEAPSCIRRGRKRTPHKGAVRILLRLLSKSCFES